MNLTKLRNSLKKGDQQFIAGQLKISVSQVGKVLKGERTNDEVVKMAIEIVEKRKITTTRLTRKIEKL